MSIPMGPIHEKDTETFLDRLTTLSCKYGILITGQLSLRGLTDEDYLESYKLLSEPEQSSISLAFKPDIIFLPRTEKKAN